MSCHLVHKLFACFVCFLHLNHISLRTQNLLYVYLDKRHKTHVQIPRDPSHNFLSCATQTATKIPLQSLKYSCMYSSPVSCPKYLRNRSIINFIYIRSDHSTIFPPSLSVSTRSFSSFLETIRIIYIAFVHP